MGYGGVDWTGLDWTGLDWTGLAQYSDKWGAFVNMVTNLRVP
jgi:hypothetical protein